MRSKKVPVCLIGITTECRRVTGFASRMANAMPFSDMRPLDMHREHSGFRYLSRF